MEVEERLKKRFPDYKVSRRSLGNKVGPRDVVLVNLQMNK